MDADQAIEQVIDRAADYAVARAREMSLEDQRSLVKSEAITRIMQKSDPQKDGKLYSATAAEALVMTDAVYALHRQDQSEATTKAIMAGAQYEAAKFRARLLTATAEVTA